jgi:hypothetical protein
MCAWCRKNYKNIVAVQGTEIKLCKHTAIGELYILEKDKMYKEKLIVIVTAPYRTLAG